MTQSRLICSHGLSPNSESSTNTSQFYPSLAPPRQLLGDLYALSHPMWPPSPPPPPPPPPQESSSSSQQMWNLPEVMNRGRLHARLPPQAQMDGGGIKVLPAPQWPTLSRRAARDDVPALESFFPRFHDDFCWRAFTPTNISKPNLTVACDVSQ